MDEFEQYFIKAANFLSVRPRSVKEVYDFLQRKKTNPVLIERIINLLKEKKFLDDTVFTKWWIEQRLSFKPKSIRFIKMELKQKGVSGEVIESGIRNYELGEKDEVSLAKKLIHKKIEKYKGLSKKEVYEKLGAFLARQGFDFETIKRVIDDVTQEGV